MNSVVKTSGTKFTDNELRFKNSLSSVSILCLIYLILSTWGLNTDQTHKHIQTFQTLCEPSPS